MGEASRRRQRLGKMYGAPNGSDKLSPCESIVIYKSGRTGKWAVGLEVSSTELKCLDVFYDYEMARLDAAAARETFSAYTWPDVLDGKKWNVILKEYIQKSASLGVVSDDECIAVHGATRLTPIQVNAQMRELELLSDEVWRRDAANTKA